MNVGSTQTQVSATASASRSARELGGTTATEATDSSTLFLDALLQAAAPPPAAAAIVAAVAGAVAGSSADGDADEPVLDWVLPVLPSSPATIPDRDAGPQPRGAAVELPLAGLPVLNDDGQPTPLPNLLDDAIADANARIGEGTKVVTLADASGSAASLVGPRVEATGTGGGVQTVVRHVATPVNDSRWAAHVGQEVRILVERGVQGATLRLTPEHLGPVDVRIDIVNDKANVVFNAAQADTRAALTDAIPKLREMFAGAGLALGQADVRQDAPGGFASPGTRPPARDGVDPNREEAAVAAVSTLRVGMVDAYA
jgi:flagellar hook-length control protein FliK